MKNNSIKYVTFLYSAFSLVSFLYAVFYQQYNGDFIDLDVELPIYILLLNLFFTVLPFYIIYVIYKKRTKQCFRKVLKVPVRIVNSYFYFLITWDICITVLYGVGKMEGELYSAPSIITFLIQIFNRFNVSLVGIVCIFLNKDHHKSMLIAFLLIILSLLRNSLGLFIPVLIALFISNSLFVSFVKRYKMLLVICLLCTPFIVRTLYSIRDYQRGREDDLYSDMGTERLLAGKLSGRLSSFSNSAIIMQNLGYFYIEGQGLSPFYYVQGCLYNTFGKRFKADVYPEQILVDFADDNHKDGISYMAGLQGNLLFALFKSPIVFIANILIWLLLIYIVFFFSRMLPCTNSNALAFLLLMSPTVGGVSNEYMSLINGFFFLFLFLILYQNFIFNRKKE